MKVSNFILFSFILTSCNCFGLDLSSFYNLWNAESTLMPTNNVEKDNKELFKKAIDKAIEKAKNGLADSAQEHTIAKREIKHNLIKDSLGIQILTGLNEITEAKSPYVQSVIGMQIVFCSGELVSAVQFDDSELKISIVDKEILFLKAVPKGIISLICDEDSVLVTVGSESSAHSWAAKICVTCQESPYTQGISPVDVVSSHHLYSGESPRFAFCSQKVVTIIRWKREYFQAPIVIHTFDCKSVKLVSIHSIDYLIIAEYGNLEIYKIQDFSYDHVQTVKIANATDIEAFSIGEGISKSFYLLIVDRNDYNSQKTKPVILKWYGNTYIIHQCLNVVEVTGIATISVDNKLIIVVTSSAQGTVFYQFNGFKFVETFQYSSSVLALPIAVSFTHAPNGTIFLAGADTYNLVIYTADFFTKNEIKDWHETALEACEKLKHRIIKTNITDLISKVNNSFFINQIEPIVINDSINLETVNVTDIFTEKLLKVRLNETYSHAILLDLRRLWEKLNQSKNKLQKIKKLLTRTLKTYGNQTVNGTYSFNNVSIRCEDCNVESVNVVILNEQNVTDIKDQVIYTDINETIDSLTFEHELSIKHLNIKGLLNGLNISDFLFNNSKEEVTGSKTFVNKVSIHNVTVDGLVDGIAVSPEDLLLIHGDQNVTGNLNFASNISVKSLHVRDLLDEVNVDEFYNKTVTFDEDFHIEGHPVFNYLKLEKDLNITRGNLIDNIDIFDLNDNAFRTDQNDTITASYYFENVTSTDGVVGHFDINAIKFPEDVLLIHESTVLEHSVTFNQNVSVKNLHVNYSINGVILIEDENFPKQLDIMVRHIEQTVTGHKFYSSNIHLRKNSTVTGEIDGIDLSEFAKNVAFINMTQVIPGTVLINGTVIFKDFIEVEGLIDGTKVDQIFEHGVRLNSTVLPDFNITFHKNVEANQIKCKNINEIDTTEDLLFKNSSQMIFGNKTFVDGIYIKNDSIIDGLINGVNLTFFEDVLYIHGNQTITANKTFLTNIFLNNAIVNGTVDTKYIPEDFVPINITNNITVLTVLKFHVVKSRKTTVKRIEINNLLNEVNLTEFYNDTLLYNEEQIVVGDKYIKGGITFANGSDNQLNGLINNINLTEVYEDAVFLNKDQVIGGNKTFHGSVSFEDLNFTGLFDHVSDWEFRENWLRQEVNQTIYGDLLFKKDLSFNESLHIDGYLNGINLTELYETTVKIDEETTIDGQVFLGSTTSFGNISVGENINGIDFSEDVVQIHKNYTIHGKKTFEDILIREDLNSPIVDDVNITDLCENTLLNYGDQNITGTLTINGTVNLEDNLIVTNFINRINLTEFFENVITTDGRNVLSGFLNVTNLTINSQTFVNNTINGIDFDEFCRNYLSKTINQTITGKYTFKNNVEILYLRVNSIVTDDGEVNGVNIAELNRTVLTKIGNQRITGTCSFTKVVNLIGDLDVDGTVDHRRIPEDVVIVGQNNTIFGKKTFKNLTVIHDLKIKAHKTIQTVDVSKWAESAVYISSNDSKEFDFVINGTKVFHTSVSFENITVEKLNNLTIDEQTVLLVVGNQTIDGIKTIYNDIHFSNITNSLINNINITNLDETTVKSNEENIITGHYTFETIQNFTDIDSFQYIDGVNVTKLFEYLRETVDLSRIENLLNETKDFIGGLKFAVNHQAVLLNYYYKLFKLPNATGFAKLNDKILVFEHGDDGCDIFYYLNNPNDVEKVEPITIIENAEINGVEYVAVAIAEGSSNCQGGFGAAAIDFPGTLTRIELITTKDGEPYLLANIGTGMIVTSIDIVGYTDHICIVVSSTQTSMMYCINTLTSALSKFALEPSSNSINQASFHANDHFIFSAVNTISDIHQTELRIYNISTDVSTSQDLAFYDLIAMHFVEFRGQVFLAIAKRTTHAGYGAVIIYHLRDGNFEKFQMIFKVGDYFLNPIDVASVKIYDQEMYLIVLSDRIRDNVVILKYEGAEGFKFHSTVSSRGGQKLFVLGDYLGVVAKKGHLTKSMLFKSKLRGKRPY